MEEIGEKLRYFTVVVNNGSGCLYQPNFGDFDYILTSNHNVPNVVKKLEEIKVSRSFEDYQAKLFLNPLELFRHPKLDYAILKIEKVENPKKFKLKIRKMTRGDKMDISGFPNYMRKQPKNPKPEYRTSLKVVIDIDRTLKHERNMLLSINPQNFDAGASQNIEGFSGSGIFYIQNNDIYLCGVFPKLNDPHATHQMIVGFTLDGFYEISNMNDLELFKNQKERDDDVNEIEVLMKLIKNGKYKKALLHRFYQENLIKGETLRYVIGNGHEIPHIEEESYQQLIINEIDTFLKNQNTEK